MRNRLVIVRHGNTFEAGEAPRRVGARTDLPLTQAGRQQAMALGRHFTGLGLEFSTALAGNLSRTRETAELILAAQPVPPTFGTASFLTEIDHGPDEDQPEDAVLARIGAEALAAWDRDAVPPPDWQVDVAGRVAAWRDFMASAAGDVLLVTSNGAARFALLALLDPTDRPEQIKLRTGSYGIISSDNAGLRRLSDWNRRPD